MKRIGLILFTIQLVAFPLFSQTVSIPDTAFLYALIEAGVDTDEDGQISVAEAETVTYLPVVLDLEGDDGHNISDLTGLEAFINIDTLICVGTDITEIDVSNNLKLKYLNLKCDSYYYGRGYLTSLDLSNNTMLKHLDCYLNCLSSLDISNSPDLEILNCGANRLTALDISNNTRLNRLKCLDNQLESLNVSNNPELSWLECWNNKLHTLDFSNNPKLEVLNCGYNYLDFIDLSNCPALKKFSCYYNGNIRVCVWEGFPDGVRVSSGGSYVEFTTECGSNTVNIPDTAFLHALIDEGVDTNEDSLISYAEADLVDSMDVAMSNISDMAGIEAFVNLEVLNCYMNHLSNLDVSKNIALKELQCGKNQLVSLNVSGCYDMQVLDCRSNQLVNLDVSKNTSLTGLELTNMPTLQEVCVWTTPFPLDGGWVNTNGSPNVNFTTECMHPILIIPDSAFLHALIDEGVDINGDSLISYGEAAAVTKLIVGREPISYPERSLITDLTGLEAFVNIDTLNCNYTAITSLDCSFNKKLIYLHCGSDTEGFMGSGSGNLKFVNVSNNTELTTFICYHNQLNSLDLSNNLALERLNLQGNVLHSIDLPLKGALKSINLSHNHLSNLLISDYDSLMNFECRYNALISLVISNNPQLRKLDIRNNRLTNLVIPDNPSLTSLYLDGNKFTSLEFLDLDSLMVLSCRYNPLTHLVISDCSALHELDMQSNLLTSVEISGNKELNNLFLSENQISNFLLEENPNITFIDVRENQLTDLDVSGLLELNSLRCATNQLHFLNLSRNKKLRWLDIADMPTLGKVCVWTIPFPPEDYRIDTTGSPSVYFKDCVAPELSILQDSLYRPGQIRATCTEDGRIYIVAEDTDRDLISIRTSTLDSATVYAGAPAELDLTEMGNDTYWLYAIDLSGNISEAKAFSIFGVDVGSYNQDFFRIWPNPTYTMVTAEMKKPGSYDFKLTNLSGECIYAKRSSGSILQIDLSSFQNGIYFITIRSKDFVTSRKIIKL